MRASDANARGEEAIERRDILLEELRASAPPGFELYPGFEIMLDAMVPGADSGYPRPVPGSDMEFAAKKVLEAMGHPDIWSDPPDLSNALQEMGLEIERQKLPIEYLVIDQVSLEPTDN